MGKTYRKEKDPFTSGKKKKAFNKKVEEKKKSKYRKSFKDYVKE